MKRGDAIERADAIGTLVFALATAGAVAARSLRPAAVAVSLGLFAVGCAVFLWAYLAGLGRSRRELVSVPGLFFLSGSAPKAVRRRLLALWALQLVVGITGASLRPFTPLAFGVLAPMFGLALCGLWAARHGEFPPREQGVAADPASASLRDDD